MQGLFVFKMVIIALLSLAVLCHIIVLISNAANNNRDDEPK